MADDLGWYLLGDDAVLVEVSDAEAVARLGAALRAAPPHGVVDVVPAACTVLVRGSARDRSRWAGEVRRVAVGSSSLAPTTSDGRLVEIPVVYDGADLAQVAKLAGLSADEVVARHLAGEYRVAFDGFMPGFAYLVGLDPVLHVPRLDTPRTRVPAGAVAIAGEYAAVYPRPTPGGWRLLGHTEAVLFDPANDDRPALLSPGDQVRFILARARVTAPLPDEPAPASATVAAPERGATHEVDVGCVPTRAVRLQTHRTRADAPEAGPVAGVEVPASTEAGPVAGVEVLASTEAGPVAGVEVLATGMLVLVEDLGRAGLAAIGVPRSGAADPAALRAANRLVGNAAGAAGLEVVLGGLVVRFTRTTAVALTGSDAHAELDGVPVPLWRAVRVPAGATLVLGAPDTGLRTWLAVRGGIEAPAVLGSCSSDVLSGLGPAPLAPGDWLPLGHAFDGLPVLDEDARCVGTPAVRQMHAARATAAQAEATRAPDPEAQPGPAAATGGASSVPAVVGLPAVVELPVTVGPRSDWLTEESRRRLGEQVWTVTAASSRVALRLDGQPLTRARGGELASEGLVLGAVQVPPDGRPVVFGPDHPVTGGYPVVAVLTADGVTRAAQCRPGDRVRFVVRAG